MSDQKQTNANAPEGSRCAAGRGPLPACAPLAVPYVPMQQDNAPRYCRGDALAQGTLFPELDLPFHLQVKGQPVEQTPESELQALCFVLGELGLYLDTHPEDQEAFAVFQRYAKLEQEGRERYEAQYGPLTQKATARSERYTWVNDPWPWNKKGE